MDKVATLFNPLRRWSFFFGTTASIFPGPLLLLLSDVLEYRLSSITGKLVGPERSPFSFGKKFKGLCAMVPCGANQESGLFGARGFLLSVRANTIIICSALILPSECTHSDNGIGSVERESIHTFSRSTCFRSSLDKSCRLLLTKSDDPTLSGTVKYAQQPVFHFGLDVDSKALSTHCSPPSERNANHSCTTPDRRHSSMSACEQPDTSCRNGVIGISTDDAAADENPSEDHGAKLQRTMPHRGGLLKWVADVLGTTSHHNHLCRCSCFFFDSTSICSVYPSGRRRC